MTYSSESILIVEDETALLESMAYTLRQEGYEVHCAKDGEEGLRLARQLSPHLVLLDIMLPGFSGLEVCRMLRKESRVPIIMLTAKDSETDKIVGLELGADDYITKPFSIPEVLARIRAVMRRAQTTQENHAAEVVQYHGKNFTVDFSTYELAHGEKKYSLSRKECDLLKMFIQHKRKVLQRERIIENVWGDEFTGDDKTLDVHIRRLRQKIEDDPDKPKIIVTVRGVGYRFAEQNMPHAPRLKSKTKRKDKHEPVF